MRSGRSWAALALVATLLLPAGCGGSGNGDATGVSVYFVRERKIAAARREVSDSMPLAAAAAAVEELLEGTREDEADAGLLSAVPEDTRLLGLTVRNRTAVADFSAEFAAAAGRLATAQRFAQVVYTLTQFPGIARVRFEVEGRHVPARGKDGVAFERPVDRASYESVTPPVLIESPVVGSGVRSPLRVRGTANTFEATFFLHVVDQEGRRIAERLVTATSGSGTRGAFDVTVSFRIADEQRGTLVAFERSAKDGSTINVVQVPLELRPP